MPLSAVILDSTPLGLVTQASGKSAEADDCRTWMEDLLTRGVRVYVPEVADYEVRRELVRSGQTGSITRLNNLKRLARYLPITTDVMLTAADKHALDGDVIVASQALSLGLPRSAFFVATKNARHLSRFVPADLWSHIKP